MSVTIVDASTLVRDRQPCHGAGSEYKSNKTMKAITAGVESNTIVVMAPDEAMLARRRFVNSDDGFVEMLDAVTGYPNRVWAVEGANGVGRSVAQRLVAFDETVVDEELVDQVEGVEDATDESEQV